MINLILLGECRLIKNSSCCSLKRTSLKRWLFCYSHYYVSDVAGRGNLKLISVLKKPALCYHIFCSLLPYLYVFNNSLNDLRKCVVTTHSCAEIRLSSVEFCYTITICTALAAMIISNSHLKRKRSHLSQLDYNDGLTYYTSARFSCSGLRLLQATLESKIISKSIQNTDSFQYTWDEHKNSQISSHR